MFGSDPYFEIPAPLYLQNLDQLPWACEMLTRNHLGVPTNPLKYLGLFKDISSVTEYLNQESVTSLYEVVGIRRHCISGVFVRSENKTYSVIGIALRSRQGKRIDYVDVIAEAKEADDYQGELLITEEIFSELISNLHPRGNFHRRRESQNYFLIYNPIEQ